MGTQAVQEFLDKHIDATLNRSAGRWDFVYRPYGDDRYMFYFHTAPTDDGNHTIRTGAFTPRAQKVYFVFEPVEMTGREPDYSADAVSKFVSGWLALHQESVAP